MMRARFIFRSFFLTISLFWLVPSLVSAQILQVIDISISGNKRTKTKIIEREITFVVGDRIAEDDLQSILDRSEQNIQNTGLFVKTIVETEVADGMISVYFTVSESWYLYPTPIFELADRNFNVWWKEQNRALNRVNFGIRLVHFNLTGHRDKLKLKFQDGYTKKYEVDYIFPGINKAQTLGIFANVLYSRAREIAYITDFNKLLFNNFEDQFQLQRFRVAGGLSFRPGFYASQTFKVQYSDNAISDNIAFDLNPEYFFNGKNNQKHFTFQYNYIFDDRDIKPYPIKGEYFSVLLQKDGIGLSDDVNSLISIVEYRRYISLNSKASIGLIGKSKVSFIREQLPYTHVSSLGYEDDVLNGYELYVVDGLDYVYAKTALRFQLFNNEFNLGKTMPIRQFKVLPYKLFFVVNNDFGYVNSPFYNHYGEFNNQVLWGGGVGLHFLIYFDKLISIEYNVNKFGEKGLFLSFDFSL